VRRLILDAHPLEVVAGSKLEFLVEEKKTLRRSVHREKVEMVSQRMMAVLLSEREE
jgi:gamma-glutamyl-gamma-aminobutyrate hydrolase PuuD